MRLERFTRFSLVIGCLWFSFTLQAQSPIHLRHGTYADSSSTCEDAPLAALKMWDGSGFGGAHSSQCVAKVTDHRATRFHIANTCSALGDGTPATPDTERASVTVLGPQRFRYVRDVPGGQDSAEYRWCSAH